MNRLISIHVIRRLPRYLRLFEELIIKNVERISSYRIAELMDVTPSQVRQDFALYGTFGMQGYGYHVQQGQ